MAHQNESPKRTADERILVQTRVPARVFKKLKRKQEKSPDVTMAAFLRRHLTKFVEE